VAWACRSRSTSDKPGAFDSHFGNAPFEIDESTPAEAKTCPLPSVFAANGVVRDSVGTQPGGGTRDIVHRFYQEQFQIDGGKQDRYLLGSDNGTVPTSQRTVLDSNGFPNSSYPSYTTSCVVDGAVTAACPVPLNLAYGDYAVNTIQPIS
jgi:hypothetical protein